MPKTKREIAREVDEFLAYSKYTSDGRYWGLGGGRSLAVREFQPQGGFRWHMG
jgi:hypothetical protein